jgi:hypothetical protein
VDSALVCCDDERDLHDELTLVDSQIGGQTEDLAPHGRGTLARINAVPAATLAQVSATSTFVSAHKGSERPGELCYFPSDDAMAVAASV